MKVFVCFTDDNWNDSELVAICASRKVAYELEQRQGRKLLVEEMEVLEKIDDDN